jgi:isoquinoline 1-oxidoreductase alpha subunit
MIKFKLNGKAVVLGDEVAEDTPLLWALRDTLKLTGTKYGCGISECGACTVHMDGDSIQSCVTDISEADGTEITTIEGLSQDGDHPVQNAWRKHGVPQCGFCQSGQMMMAAAMLANNDDPTNDDIKSEMWNICRCGTYPRIQAAIKDAAREMRERGDQ